MLLPVTFLTFIQLMAKLSPDSIAEFRLAYKNDEIKVHTKDHIHFLLEFKSGQKKEMVFDFSTDMDLNWTFIPDTDQKQAKEIGRLIEKKMWAA